MTKSHVLDRVASDVSLGRTHLALQRLHSLVAAHPTDLDLRGRLAAVHLAVGDPVEAGRWQYLTETSDPPALAAVRAFEQATPTPAKRLRALRWPVPPAQAPTAHARHRLLALAATAPSVAVPDPAPRGTAPAILAAAAGWPRRTGTRLALAVALAIGFFFAVLGAVTVLDRLT